MKRLLTFIVCILGLFVIRGQCQNFPTLHYGIEDGLPSNNVYYTYKDHQGFMWIAGDKGIARYNGVKFELFTTFNGLSCNEILFFHEDNYGRLWLGTYSGELCYYQHDSFHTAANTAFLKVNLKPRSFIRNILVEADSSITFMYSAEMDFVNIKRQTCKIIYCTPEVKKDTLLKGIIYIKKVSDNNYCIIGLDGNVSVDSNGAMLSEVNNSFKHTGLHQCGDEYYLTNTCCFYSLKDPGNPINIPSSLRDNIDAVHAIHFDGSEYLFQTNNGIYHQDGSLIFSGAFSFLGQDNKQNYWISTPDKGIYILSRDFRTTKLSEKAYSAKARSAFVMGNTPYFSTDSVLYCIEAGKVKKTLDFNDDYRGLDNSKSVPGFLVQDSGLLNFRGNYCIAVEHVNTGKASTKLRKTTGNYGIYRRVLLSGNKIYAQQRNEIVVADYTNGKLSGGIAFHPIMASGGRIYCMAQSSDHTIWYSQRNELCKLTENDSSLVVRSYIGFKYFDFFGDHLVGYLHDNTLLVCSNVNDHFRVDTIPAQNCIWENFYKIDPGHILISTNGLYRILSFNGSTKKWNIAPIDNPFIPLRIELFCCDSANCYFFKDGSVTTIRTSALFEKVRPPVLYFGSVKAGQHSYLITDKIKLPFSESKNITVSFSPLSYGGNDITCQYSISKTKHDSWSNLQDELINIGTLFYGTYTIKIRAKTISSAYSGPIVFQLEIERPFWATWWFITLMVLLTCIVAGIIVRQRVLFVIRKNEKEHTAQIRFIKSEYTALNALMNPHFIFNTLNNLQGLFNQDDKLAANKYLRIFANLIRQNMHNVSMEEITLQKEIDLVTNYLLLEKLRFGNKLHYTINIAGDIDMSTIMVPPLLIQPLVENSIKHGIRYLEDMDGHVCVNLYERDNTLCIEVKDNGIGITQAAQMMQNNNDDAQSQSYESTGLDNIRKRIEQLSIIQDKKITFDITETRSEIPGNNAWTTVTITIPLA